MCPSVARLALPPRPQHVHSAVDVPWAVRVGARGGLGRAAQGALSRPLPVLWRGRFCLCTFASFVMKPNKNPMFSSLPPPLFFLPPFSTLEMKHGCHRYTWREAHKSMYEYGHADLLPSPPPPHSQLLGPVFWKGSNPRLRVLVQTVWGQGWAAAAGHS